VAKAGWSISVKNASAATLMELYQLLNASDENRPQALEIQRELVRRARAERLTPQEILRILVAGVGTKRRRGLIAREWCDALGITETEARRMAD
jgi:hypothetical protein